MPVSVQVPKDHPLMLAWEAHKQSEEYANSRKWAMNSQHVDGSLWALFEAGWRAAHLTQPAQAVDVGEILRVIVYMRDRVGECANEHYVADHEDMEEWIAMLTAALPKDSNGAEGVGK